MKYYTKLSILLLAGLAALCLATSCTKDTPDEGTQSTDDVTTVEGGTETAVTETDPGTEG